MTPREPGGPAARVLVVEDFDALRTLVIRVLTMEGLDVTGVGTAAAALELGEHEDFDLLITDHDVPGGDGTDIARRCVAHNPELRVLFVSGSARGSLDLEVQDVAAVRFLQKPFSIDELALCVHEVLSSPPD